LIKRIKKLVKAAVIDNIEILSSLKQRFKRTKEDREV
jgi:hypothetical protein